MLFEIRNYHFNPDLFEGYKTWAKAEALPYLSPRLDIVGFWLKTSDPTATYAANLKTSWVLPT